MQAAILDNAKCKVLEKFTLIIALAPVGSGRAGGFKLINAKLTLITDITPVWECEFALFQLQTDGRAGKFTNFDLLQMNLHFALNKLKAYLKTEEGEYKSDGTDVSNVFYP